ncbi:AfsA-related hotdog domain-containing protein [Streptomyces physcomitrii]|uniref:A-factor biosynthesis hotdog domain-containing protein n=1 Tax=Streptomyces physcomitrii TaxID=2724184 RepID=A0ABX1H687_9ACTN|nr:AfsA-related hotdog domain-containing protein [Streptomyces physcomitrii]NKI43865.1 hypothetical protein [Streptomyces physcomitrii]
MSDYTAGAAVRALPTRHLIHRPRSTAPGPAEEFVLTGELPRAHPLFNDGPGSWHEPAAAAEMVREAAEFIGPQHFGIAPRRTGLFYRFGIEAGDLGAWRTAAGPGLLTAAMTVTPDKVIDHVPRALEFRAALDIDDRPAGTATARLIFLAPLLGERHRSTSRREALDGHESAAYGDSDRAPADRDPAAPAVEPASVGRFRPDNVLLQDAEFASSGRLSARVLIPPAHPLRPPAGHPVPSALLLEAVRQSSLLAAHRTHRLPLAGLLLSSLDAQVRGYAEPELPLRCTAIAGAPHRAADGSRRAPLTLTLSQQRRTVIEATATVTHLP